MKLLSIDDQLIDLYPSTVIAQTLQVFDPGRLGSVVTNYTSSIRAPKTFNNEQVFSFLSNSKIKSNVPYTSLSCTYQENGIPIIQNARVIFKEISEKEYSLNIFSGPWGFFERIQGKKLWDLDFSDINGVWSASTRDGYRNTTTGIVQALLDDGQLESPSPPVILYQESVIRSPQIYYHTVIEKIFSSFGFELEGDIFENLIFKNLCMPLAVSYKDSKWLDAKTFISGADGAQVIVNPTTEETIIFDQNVKQGSDNFYNPSTGEYVIVNPDTALGYFRQNFISDLAIEVTGGTVDLKLEATDLTPDDVTNVGTGTHSLGLTSTTGFKDGDVIKVTVVANTGTPTVLIVSGSFYAIPFTGVDSEETYSPTIPIGGYVYFQKLFEDVLLIDFLKEFCVRFNVQITQINNNIVCNTLNYILDQFTGPDWTDKRDAVTNKIKYSFSSYGQRNFLTSPKDTEFTPDLTDAYGDGSFDIPNENLKESTTIYTSIFGVTQMINTFGVFMLNLNVTRINEISMLPEFVRYPGNRLFFVRDKYEFEPDVNYDSNDRDDYLVAYYSDPNQERELSWQFFIDNFHQKFIDRCLRRVRLLTREYNLKDLDIFAFNQQIPVWDDGERFLVTKISNYVSRKLTTVELLKIESNPSETFTAVEGIEIEGTLTDTLEVLGNTVDAILDIQLQLIETVTGNPTWEATFDNSTDLAVTSCTGSTTDTDTLDPHSGVLNVDADVVKTFNDGNGTDGFPVVIGWVEWLRNGVQVNTETFNSSSHSSLQGLNFTYTNVKAWETLEVVVHEDGSTP